MEKELRIIKIIDNNTLIGKGGTDEDITQGSRFTIVGKNDGEEIIDPETKESLGFLGLEKGTVIADQVEEHFTVYKSQFIEEKNKYGRLARNSSLFSSASMQGLIDINEKIPAHYQRLNVNLDEITGSNEESTIKIGDYLRQID